MLESRILYPHELNLDDGQVLILCPLASGVLSHKEFLQYAEKFSGKGYELLYLPEIVNCLDEELISYFLPEAWRSGEVSAELFQNRIASQLGILLDAPAAIVQGDGTVLMTPEEGDEQIGDFLDLLFERIEPQIRYCSVCDSMMSPDAMYEADECPPCGCIPPPDSGEIPSDEEYDIEQLIDELKEVNEAKLRDLGLSESALRFLMGHVVPKLSRMTITRHAKIILEDYAGREIKMDDKTKALYFLYLRHPEGLSIKDLTDHTKELMDLYQSISGRDDPEAMKQTIENLCDPFQNNANISLSRIKKAFVEAFSPELAKTYYVDGERGGLRSISLSRELVTWETIR